MHLSSAVWFLYYDLGPYFDPDSRQWQASLFGLHPLCSKATASSSQILGDDYLLQKSMPSILLQTRSQNNH